MRLQRKGLVAVAVLTLLVALVVNFPARVAYNLASSPFFAMSGITGTVWNGNAREFSTHGIYLRKLDWRMHPSRLLAGKAVFEVTASPVSGFFDGVIEIGLGGKLTVQDLTAAMPLQMFERAVGIPGLRGKANIKIDRLELVNGRAVALDGTVDVDDLVVPTAWRTSLGGYRTEFFTQNNGIIGSVEDADGIIDLAGTLNLTPDREYAFLGYIAPKPVTPDSLRQRMRFLPQTDQPEQHELRLEGSY